jgi:hypothetical protein
MNDLRSLKTILALMLCSLMILPTTSIMASPTPTTQPASGLPAIDVPYIYNITAALSNIVFTCYNESRGDIAKGRAFGTIGEHTAAQILYDNMTRLGLDTTLQRLQRNPKIKGLDILTQLEVLNYTLTLNDRPLDCYMAGSWKGPRGTPDTLNTTITATNLHVKPLPKYPCLYNPSIAKDTQDFVFIGPDHWNDPNASLPLYDLIKPYTSPLKSYIVFHLNSLFNIEKETTAWYRMYPHCQGLLLYDFIPDCHDHIYLPSDMPNSLPVAFITGNDGHDILNNLSTSTINLSVNQHLNTSVESYNVIGTLPGTDTSKTILISCLYDGWWNQATADSAIGMGMVLAIAKYFIDNHITPQYTLKFAAFAGEEITMGGAKYFDVTCNDTIIANIDLNQLGFTQNTPRISLDIISNHPLFLNHVMKIFQRTDYVNRTGNTTDITPIYYLTGSLPSDASEFAMTRPLCKTLVVLKDGGWLLHHRDGQNHMAGDALSYFNWTDTQVTTEMLVNLTLDLASPQSTLGSVIIGHGLLNPFLTRSRDF